LTGPGETGARHTGEIWRDLVNVSGKEVAQLVSVGVLSEVDEILVRAKTREGNPLPDVRVNRDETCILGVLRIPTSSDEALVASEDVRFVLTREHLVTIRSSASDLVVRRARAACRPHDDPADAFQRFLDSVGQEYLGVIHRLTTAIERLDSGLDEWLAETKTDEAVRSDFRRIHMAIVHLHRMLAVLRERVDDIADNRLDLHHADELISKRGEERFAALGEELDRTMRSLEFARQLLSDARSNFQTEIAKKQNSTTQTLTAIASLVLVPTVIVGLYGENFHSIWPSQSTTWGFAATVGIIATVTVLQVVYFKRKKWL
jgi:Mg2+ and Co2+ transporter CorA